MTRRTPAQYDWSKALFNDRRLNKHFTSPRRSKIRTVTLHHSTIVGNGNGAALEAMYDVWQKREASANYGVDCKNVWQYVSDNDAAWANATSSNHETLSIEHTNSTGKSSWKISDETMATGQRLVATLHLLYGLGRPSRKTVKVHQDYFATACPGPFMMAHLSEYIANAARIYDDIKVSPSKPAPTPAKPKATATIRALQFNMPGPDKIPNGDERAAAGAKLALSADPSIIGWNELVGPKDDGSASDFALTVDSHLGKNWFLYTPTTPFNENYISFDTDVYAIAKSYPDVILPSPKGAGRRHLTRLVLKHRATGLLFGVGQTHLVNGDSAAAACDREAQAAQIVTSMRWMCFDFRGHLLPYIVQGDFNERDRLKAFDSLEYTRWSGGSSTTRDHATYTNYAKDKPSTNTDWIIDAQVVSNEWGVVGYNVVRELNDDGTYVQPRPSDHDPIITAIRTIA